MANFLLEAAGDLGLGRRQRAGARWRFRWKRRRRRRRLFVLRVILWRSRFGLRQLLKRIIDLRLRSIQWESHAPAARALHLFSSQFRLVTILLPARVAGNGANRSLCHEYRPPTNVSGHFRVESAFEQE